MIGQDLLSLENFFGEPDLNLNHRVGSDQAVPWVAVVDEELTVADEEHFSLFDVAGKPPCFQVRLQHVRLQCSSHFLFVFDRIFVLLLGGPDRCNPDVSDLFGRLLVNPNFSRFSHLAKLRSRMPNEVLLLSDRQSLVLVEVL